MKKLIFILLTSIVFTSCKTNYDLQGIWFGARSTYDDASGFVSPLPMLLDFSGDSVNEISMERNEQDRIANTQTFKYTIKQKKLTIDSWTTVIKDITPDSLILNQPGNRNHTFVFKKAETFPSPDDHIFYHHAYALIIGSIGDTIDFINDSTALSIGQNFYGTWSRSTKWDVAEYKQMRFLILENMETGYFLLKEMPDHSICLFSPFHNGMIIQCHPITIKRDTSGLAGRWETLTNPDYDIIKPPYFDGNPNPVLTINISQNNIETEKSDIRKKYIWELNSTNEFMILTSDDGSRQEIWKIMQIGNDELILGQTDSYGSSVNEIHLMREVK